MQRGLKKYLIRKKLKLEIKAHLNKCSLIKKVTFANHHYKTINKLSNTKRSYEIKVRLFSLDLYYFVI